MHRGVFSTHAIVTLAAVKEAVRSFEAGDANLPDVLDEIIAAVEA